MTLAALIATVFAFVALVAVVAAGCDLVEQRNEARRDVARLERESKAVDAYAASRMTELTIERDLWKARHEALQAKHRDCPTTARGHLRVVRGTTTSAPLSDDAWFDRLYGDSHPGHGKKADER